MSTSEVRPPYHHGSLPQSLVETALEVLHEGGTAALSLRAVARRAGVSPTAPYRHFADKEALLAAVAAHGFGLLAARLMKADGPADTAEAALVAQGVAYVQFACDDPALFRLMFGRNGSEAHAALHDAASRAYAVLAQRVAGMADATTRDDLTLAAWSLVHGLASLVVDGQLGGAASNPADLAARISRLMFRFPHRP